MVTTYTKQLRLVTSALKDIGYSRDLIRESYEYAVISEAAYATRKVPLAAFAQSPPSYRNSCIAVVCSNGTEGAENVCRHRDVGAPIVLELTHDRAVQWWLGSDGNPRFVRDCGIGDIGGLMLANRKGWTPQALLRAKTLTEPHESVLQTDIFDCGFFPQLQTLARDKLDILLRSALKQTASAFKRRRGREIDPRELFRLVFRFVAAKTLQDRQHPGNWQSSDPREVLRAVESYYGTADDALHSSKITDVATMATAWEAISSTLHFQNLSSHDLAFVYENTLITRETRKIYGTHSTPARVAELVMSRLPIEQIPQERRFILEPCSGHGAFLLAAMQRLRELLPPDYGDIRRHQYLQRRLVGLEIDAFAVEVCRLSLILADYPNKNNWRVRNADVFAKQNLEDELRTADCILCNPPYEDFCPRERTKYALRSVHKPEEVLRRILDRPPQMLGFVLPRSFAMGRAYARMQLDIARAYERIELISLPDKVFQHSDAETVLLMACERRTPSRFVRLSSREITDATRRKFLEENWLPLARTRVLAVGDTDRNAPGCSLWIPRLSRVWSALSGCDRLASYAHIHRGVEYSIPVSSRNASANRNKVFSGSPKRGFSAGLEKAEGALDQFRILTPTYLKIDPRLMRGNAHRLPWHQPKILVNAARKSRGPWRLVAALDTKGLVAYQRLHAVWPKSSQDSLALLAILNSPVANAFVFTQEGNRDNRISTLKSIPIPPLHSSNTAPLNLAVQELLSCLSSNKSCIHIDSSSVKQALIVVDAEVLRLYDLPPALERELLDTFEGYKRPGFVDFEGYYPSGFTAYLPLHRLVGGESKLASAENLLRSLEPIDDQTVHQALDLASWGEE